MQSGQFCCSRSDDNMKQLKTKIYYRQDYHCGATIASARVLGLHHDVSIKCLDFSDPQEGKRPCDGKAATIKSHIRVHLNSWNDIETPVQMKDAILSSGGVAAVDVTVPINHYFQDAIVEDRWGESAQQFSGR